MKQWRSVAALCISTVIPFAGTAGAMAAPRNTPGASPKPTTIVSSQTITVTAIVPPHRDIIIDSHGNITEIISNTKDDVTPTVYIGDESSNQNKRPLTDALYEQYRNLVPVGTAKYGILYQQTLPIALAGILRPRSLITGA